MNRRTASGLILIGSVEMIVSACGSIVSPTLSTPLLTLLRRDGYTVVERKNLDGGVYLIINENIPRIKVGPQFIGSDPTRSITQPDGGPANFNVGAYPVPDNLGYVLV